MVNTKQGNKFISALGVVLQNPELLSVHQKYIFVVSHMRSNSTLLAHILGSNDEISGHVEMHQSYTSKLDLLKLNYKIFRSEEVSHCRYRLDKVLHESWSISDTILSSSDKVRIIFLLREPEQTIKSIVSMWERRKSNSEARSNLIERAFKHYSYRAESLSSYSIKANCDSIFLPSEQLLSEPDLVLPSLSKWLGLEHKLSQSYNIFSNTGAPGCGDPSPAIKSGSIIKSIERRYDDVVIEPEMLTKANKIFLKCQNTLLKNCHKIEDFY